MHRTIRVPQRAVEIGDDERDGTGVHRFGDRGCHENILTGSLPMSPAPVGRCRTPNQRSATSSSMICTTFSRASLPRPESTLARRSRTSTSQRARQKRRLAAASAWRRSCYGAADRCGLRLRVRELAAPAATHASPTVGRKKIPIEARPSRAATVSATAATSVERRVRVAMGSNAITAGTARIKSTDAPSLTRRDS